MDSGDGRMEQLATAILQRSSDAVVIVDLADGTVVDLNGAYLAMTGDARGDLVGRPTHDLLVGLAEETGGTARETFEALREVSSITGVPVGFWTRLGKLRVGDLSALVLEVRGQRDAVCTIRGMREPTPEQRRTLARRELDHILGAESSWTVAATRSLAAFSRCLGWDLGALWQGAPRPEGLRRLAAWPAPPVESGPTGTLHQVWLRGAPIWVEDALAGLASAPAPAEGAGSARSWLTFPALGADGVLGVVEFASNQPQPPDAELLGMMEDFGRRFGRLMEAVPAPGDHPFDRAGPARPVRAKRSPATVPDSLRDLADAVTAASEALEGRPTSPDAEQTAAIRELTAGIGKLNQLLQQVVLGGTDASPALEPPTAKPPPAVPAGLTLKAVSRRTGIPAATLRTWEHRYGFMRPRRSPAGYRLYGEEEIARIERVKHLVAQGVRIGAAMQTVIEEAAGTDRADQSRRPADQSRAGDRGKHAEVYRLDPRTPRGRRS
jgi:DNA-binding transcriptional MerR regulator